MILILIMNVAFALSFVIGKTTLQYVQPFFFTAVRMILAGTIILTFQVVFQRKKIYLHRKCRAPIALLALFNIFLTNGLECWGLKYLSSSKTCFFYTICPCLAGLFSHFFLKEKMSKKKWLSLSIAFIGFIPILLYKTADESLVPTSFFFSLAEIVMGFAVISTVSGWIIMRYTVAHLSYCPLMANGVSMIGGGFLSLIISLCFESYQPIPVIDMSHFFTGLIFLVIVGSLIGYNVKATLLKKYSTPFIALTELLSPIITAIFGYFILQEEISIPFIASALIVFWGLFKFYQEEMEWRKNILYTH